MREGRRANTRLVTALRTVVVLALAAVLGGIGPGVERSPAQDRLVEITPRVPDSVYLPSPDWSPPERDKVEREPAPERAPATPSEQAFADKYPDHHAARQVAGEASTFHWAVIVGVNDYQGRTGSTLGSVADAQVLRDDLVRRGWRGDHVLVLTDGDGTHDWIVRALEWLQRKTDDRSTVVFSFSGHMRHASGNSAIWPADNTYLWNADFGRLIGAVQADRMWVSLQGCHAEGMRAPGVEGPNRVVTYSSTTPEKSYEDPDVGHSVQGNYLFREGISEGWGNDGMREGVSVQGAFAWAAPRANTRTAGLQTPVIADGLGEPFTLDITGPPRT